MRISDWSSDVCSSDLLHAQTDAEHRLVARRLDNHLIEFEPLQFLHAFAHAADARQHQAIAFQQFVRVITDNDAAGFGHALKRLAERVQIRSEEHTSELQSLMRISYAVFCLKKKTK